MFERRYYFQILTFQLNCRSSAVTYEATMFRHELSYIHIASFFALLQVGCQPFFEQSSQGFLVWEIFLVACDDLGLFGFFVVVFFFSFSPL